MLKDKTYCKLSNINIMTSNSGWSIYAYKSSYNSATDWYTNKKHKPQDSLENSISGKLWTKQIDWVHAMHIKSNDRCVTYVYFNHSTKNTYLWLNRPHWEGAIDILIIIIMYC